MRKTIFNNQTLHVRTDNVSTSEAAYLQKTILVTLFQDRALFKHCLETPFKNQETEKGQLQDS